MNPIEEAEQREEAQRKADKLAKVRERRRKEDVRTLGENASFRRLLAEFLSDAGVDASSYRTDAQAMAFAGGWRDAGLWWLALIRTHCPEREVQMRTEANTEAREGVTDEAEDAS